MFVTWYQFYIFPNTQVSINREDGSAVFDFAGTGHEMYGNLNAPPAVTTSAVIYCLRCLLPDIMDIPLNQGCLAPITISLPEQSLLHPSATAAVVGGNVLTSQRVTGQCSLYYFLRFRIMCLVEFLS